MDIDGERRAGRAEFSLFRLRILPIRLATLA